MSEISREALAKMTPLEITDLMASKMAGVDFAARRLSKTMSTLTAEFRHFVGKLTIDL